MSPPSTPLPISKGPLSLTELRKELEIAEKKEDMKVEEMIELLREAQDQIELMVDRDGFLNEQSSNSAENGGPKHDITAKERFDGRKTVNADDAAKWEDDLERGRKAVQSMIFPPPAAVAEKDGADEFFCHPISILPPVRPNLVLTDTFGFEPSVYLAIIARLLEGPRQAAQRFGRFSKEELDNFKDQMEKFGNFYTDSAFDRRISGSMLVEFGFHFLCSVALWTLAPDGLYYIKNVDDESSGGGKESDSEKRIQNIDSDGCSNENRQDPLIAENVLAMLHLLLTDGLSRVMPDLKYYHGLSILFGSLGCFRDHFGAYLADLDPEKFGKGTVNPPDPEIYIPDIHANRMWICLAVLDSLMDAGFYCRAGCLFRRILIETDDPELLKLAELIPFRSAEGEDSSQGIWSCLETNPKTGDLSTASDEMLFASPIYLIENIELLVRRISTFADFSRREGTRWHSVLEKTLGRDASDELKKYPVPAKKNRIETRIRIRFSKLYARAIEIMVERGNGLIRFEPIEGVIETDEIRELLDDLEYSGEITRDMRIDVDPSLLDGDDDMFSL